VARGNPSWKLGNLATWPILAFHADAHLFARASRFCPGSYVIRFRNVTPNARFLAALNPRLPTLEHQMRELRPGWNRRPPDEASQLR
jgi:hypothetical protein